MPIYPLLREAAFEPEHARAMAKGFEKALTLMGLKDRADPLCEIIAKKIIELGRQGVRDPDQFAELTIKALTTDL